MDSLPRKSPFGKCEYSASPEPVFKKDSPKTITLQIQGGRVTMKRPGRRRGGGKRGRVNSSGISKGSRRRMASRLASLDWPRLARENSNVWFLTLTTPLECWSDVAGVYSALERFLDRLDYRWMDKSKYYGTVVRRELGARRGMLHYHLIVIGPRKLPVENLERVWAQCVQTKRATLRCEIEEVQSVERVCKYVSKYVSKAVYDDVEDAVPNEASSVAVDASPEVNAAPGRGEALSKAHSEGIEYRESFGVMIPRYRRKSIMEKIRGSRPELESKKSDSGEDIPCRGRRWWYIRHAERLPWAQTVEIQGHVALEVARRLRRVLYGYLVARKKQAEIYKRWQAFHRGKGGLWMYKEDSARIAKKWAKRGVCKTLRNCWNWSGFEVWASPEVLRKLFLYCCMEAVKSGFHVCPVVPDAS